MNFKPTALRTAIAAALALAAGSASAQITDGVIKIGVVNDMSGLYADITGTGSVWAARKAVEDFGAAAKGMKVEILSADHQNKPDIGSNIVRQWIDVDKVDAIADVPTSSVGLAVNQIIREKNKVHLNSGSATSDLTNKACSPNTVHWAYDTVMLSNGTGKAMVKTGGDSWFFLTADYAFGHALERDVEAIVNANGGKVLGKVRTPLNTQDFSSFLLQAQSSKAKVIGLANAGGDTINSIKQAAEFGITKGGQNLAGLLVFVADVHSLGLQTAQGLVLTESFYWDLNDGTRAWSKEFAAGNKGRMPTMIHAGVYSSVMHYLKAVEALKSDADGVKVVEKMKEMPTDDKLFGKGTIRVDGRKMHDAYLFEVKKPNESKGPWDYYKLRATIPANEAFRPLSQSECSLVKK
ncbi:MAG TPA: ABC transporter substrate-binding protein [Burkholderiaceae bacterium]|nr:ABC transporter substrate-binding protein [Burkholderiaceae bacterium]